MDVYLPGPTRHRVSDVNTTGQDRARVSATKPTIAGNTFAILDNGWDVMPALVKGMTDELLEQGAADVVRIPVFVGGPVEPQFLDEIVAKVAGAICGLGN